MRLLRLNEVTLAGSGRVYRQGRLQAVFSAAAMTAVLAALPLFLCFAGAPWPAWVAASLPVALLGPLLAGNALATLRTTNWLLWVRDDGLWLNCRSYQDSSELDQRCVVAIDYAELAGAWKYSERYTTPRPHGGSIHYSLQALELELTPNCDLSPLKIALHESRRREQPQRSFLGVRWRSLPTHFPICRPVNGRIRIHWRGGIGNWVTPSLGQALRDLAAYVEVSEPQRRERRDWQQLSGAELDEQILSLIEGGAKFDAKRLLVQRRGYSETEARRFVEELTLSGSA